MTMKVIILQSCMGPVLPRRVNSPFPPLTAMPDTSQTLPHGVARLSCTLGTSGSMWSPSHGRNALLLGGSVVVTMAAMAMTVAVVVAMATREGAWPKGCEWVCRRGKGAQWGTRLRTQAAGQCWDLVRWCFRIS